MSSNTTITPCDGLIHLYHVDERPVFAYLTDTPALGAGIFWGAFPFETPENYIGMPDIVCGVLVVEYPDDEEGLPRLEGLKEFPYKGQPNDPNRHSIIPLGNKSQYDREELVEWARCLCNRTPKVSAAMWRHEIIEEYQDGEITKFDAGPTAGEGSVTSSPLDGVESGPADIAIPVPVVQGFFNLEALAAELVIRDGGSIVQRYIKAA